MCGVFFEGIGGWVGGTRSRCFNRGYHDLGLLRVDYHYVIIGIISKIYLKICLKTSLKQGFDANNTQNID